MRLACDVVGCYMEKLIDGNSTSLHIFPHSIDLAIFVFQYSEIGNHQRLGVDPSNAPFPLPNDQSQSIFWYGLVIVSRRSEYRPYREYRRRFFTSYHELSTTSFLSVPENVSCMPMLHARHDYTWSLVLHSLHC